MFDLLTLAGKKAELTFGGCLCTEIVYRFSDSFQTHSGSGHLIVTLTFLPVLVVTYEFWLLTYNL